MAKKPLRSPCGRFWFDEVAAEAAVRFYPVNLRFTDGEWAGKPFHLEPWQADDIIRPLFGWKRVSDNTRRYRRCVVWVPRKNGKTELAAGISHLMLVADGEIGAQVYSMAATEEQARIVYGKAQAMATLSPTLAPHLQLFKTSIYCPELMASFKPLTGKAAGKHGLSASGVVGDEVHEWADDALYTFVHQSTGARRQPLEFLISTAGVSEGFGWELWNECQNILAGTSADEETLVVIYAASPDDDPFDPATWAKANPNLGVSLKLEYLQAEAARAKESPRVLNNFLRYHLNIWTQQAVRWITPEAWKACGKEDWRGFEASLAGRKAYAGLDLSTTTDLTAWVLIFPPVEAGEPWIVLPRFFIPSARMAERVKRDKVPYDKWAASGDIFVTDGNAVDYDFVRAQVEKDCARFKVEMIAIDRWNSTQFATGLLAEGLPVVFFGQGYASMSAPSKEFEVLVLEQKLEHGNHPVLTWCAQNVAITTDPAGNIKPAKDKSTGRIDGIVATIMALGVAAQPKEEPLMPKIIIL